MRIDEMLELFEKRYRRRNRLCFPYGLHELLQLMSQSFAELNGSIRQNEAPEIIRTRLAKAVAWFCGVVNHFDDLPLAEALNARYGKMECIDCGERTCVCDREDRPGSGEAPFESILPAEYRKTIDRWGHHLGHLFGRREREMGVHRVAGRFIEEMQRLLLLANRSISKSNDLDELERRFALELAEVLANLIAVANLKKINLTAAIQEHYGRGCPACQRGRCQCPLTP